MLFNYNKCYSKNGKNNVFCVIYSERKYNTAKLAGEPLKTLGGGYKAPYRPSPKDMRNFFDDYRFELVIT